MKFKRFKRLITPLFFILLLLVLQAVLEMYAKNLPEKVLSTLAKGGTILLIVLMVWLILGFIKILKKLLLENYDLSQENNLKSRKIHTEVNVLERVVVFIIVIIAVGIILLSFENFRKIGLSLFASAGLAGIIIGFAAQKVIGTVLAGLQIAITQPIRIDDVVIVEGEWGWIEEITLTYVVVRVWDKRRIILPTTYFIEKPFQNWTRNSADILGSVFIYTDYSINVDALRVELTRILSETPLWDGDVNNLQVTDSKETTMELRALISAKNSSIAWDLRVLVREKLIAFIQLNYPDALPKTRVSITEPQRKNQNP